MARSKKARPKQVVQTPSLTNTRASMTRSFHPLNYMTAEDLTEVDMQLAAALSGVEAVLFWTGVEWTHVQRWAKIWGLKTLTIAMGPLMDPANPDSPKARKSKNAYSKYVKGASGRFADYARQHCRVVVLTNPPPKIYSSRENNTYQQLEEPILKGIFGDSPVRRIDYVHPTVDGAAHVTYQAWPCDKTRDWKTSFGGRNVNVWKRINWSYKSLTTTSQIGLKPAQRQVLPVAVSSRIPTPGNVAMGNLSSSDKSPGWTANDTNTEHAETEDKNTTPPRQGVALAERDQALSAFDIRSHDSRVFAHKHKHNERTGSEDHLIDTQVRDEVDREIDFHEVGLLRGLDRSPALIYKIKRCREPLPSTTLPSINIDNIAIGDEVTVSISEHDTNVDILFLTMKSISGNANWWKMMWV